MIKFKDHNSQVRFMDDIQKASGIGKASVGVSNQHRVEAAGRLKRGIQATLGKPLKKAIQAYTTQGDMDEIVRNVSNMTQKSDNSDMAWLEAFKTVPLDDGTGKWSSYVTTPNIQYVKLAEGEKVEIGHAEGTVATNSVVRYGGGIGWTIEAVRYRKLSLLLDNVEAFSAKREGNRANVHYSLLNVAATATGTTSFDATGSTDRDKVINTMNDAGYTLSDSLKDEGLGDMASQRLILYVNPKLRGRIAPAMTELAQALAGSTRSLQWNIDIRYTFNSNLWTGANINTGVLCLPGHKIQRAVDEEDINLMDQDILSLSWIQTNHEFWGAAVINTNQCRLVAFA